jgi:hypothetical protein
MMEVMDNTALSSQTEQAPMSKDSATRLTTDSPAAVLLQPGHHHVVQLQRSGSYGSGSPKSSEASEESSEDDDDASSTEESEDDDHGSDEEIIEAEEYEEGGWSDEEDEETRKVRELKKKLHGSDSEEILLADVLFKAPKLSLRDGGANATAAPSPAKKSALPRHLQTLHFRREKSNSTSSLYVNSTISAPNLDQVLWCMATAIWYHSTAGQDATPVLFEIFDEREYPIVKGPVDVSAPTQKDIYRFVFSIFKAEKLPAECAILCLAYIERLIANTKITLHGTNWRRVTLGALILASKVWEDQAVWNVDFLSVFPNVNVNDLNKLEKYFLGLLTYNVSLKASEYCKYYFELRELAEKDSKSFPLLPLTTADAQRLEQRAIETERRVKKLQRTSSADALPLKSPRAVLN